MTFDTPLETANMTEEALKKLIRDILDKHKRDTALTELSKVRESIPELGAYLWNEPGIS